MAEIITDSELRECKQVLSLLTGFIDNGLITATITNIQIFVIKQVLALNFSYSKCIKIK